MFGGVFESTAIEDSLNIFLGRIVGMCPSRPGNVNLGTSSKHKSDYSIAFK